jgi:uncharacterized protein (TIGR02271 family)
VKVARSEEELRIRARAEEVGRVRARKVVSEEHVEQIVPRGVEHAEVERVRVEGDDSGVVETLPDGAISIPVFEEQLVVDKRLIVRERVIVRKRTVYEEHRVEADLRRERIEVTPDSDVKARVVERERRAPSASPENNGSPRPRPRRQRPLRAKP